MATACPFPAGTSPFDNFAGFVPKYAQFKLGIHPYTIVLQLPNGQVFTLIACNSPGSHDPSSIVVPVASVSVSDAGVLPFLETLHQLHRISSVDRSLCTTPCTMQLGETIQGGSHVVFGKGGVGIAEGVLAEISPLAAAEWMYVIDAFFGFQGGSFSLFPKMQAEYLCLKEKVVTYTTANPTQIPSVLISTTNLTTGKIQEVANPTFWETAFEDAGASPVVFSESTNWLTLSTSRDAVFDLTAITSSGVVYDLSRWTTTYYNLTADTKGFSFLHGDAAGDAGSQVWRMDRRVADGFDDFPQSYAANPTLLLADLISVFSSSFNPSMGRYWARNLVNDNGYTNVQSSQCLASSAGNATSPLPQGGSFCANSNSYVPTIGRFQQSSATGGQGTTSSSTADTPESVSAGMILLFALLGCTLVAAILIMSLLVLKRRSRNREYLDSTKQGAGVGLDTLREAVTRRRWFKRLDQQDDEDLDDGVVLQEVPPSRPRIRF